jgi:N-glycosylase/DNA lyase
MDSFEMPQSSFNRNNIDKLQKRVAALESKFSILGENSNKKTYKDVALTLEEIQGALARGYCAKENEHKTMDVKLCQAQAREIMRLQSKNAPNPTT